MMQRCSERAFAMCPYRHECGTIHEATFSDNSDCAEFNRKVENMPMTNADKIRAMMDEQLAAWICMITAPRGDGKKNTRLRTWLEWLKQEVSDD